MADAPSLARVLDSARINWFAGTFGVRQDWLEGRDVPPYDGIWLYKRVGNLPDALRDAGGWPADPDDLEAALLVSGGQLRQRPDCSAALVFSTPLKCASGAPLVLDGHVVRRWVVCGDAWV